MDFVNKWKKDDPKTHDGLTNATMKQAFEKFGLAADTQEFIGHAMGLFTDDSYLQKPAATAIAAIQLYVESFFR